MKTKIGIKTRVFLSFGFFILIIINIFLCLVYYFIGNNYIENIEKNISVYYEHIKKGLDKNDSEFVLKLSEEAQELFENSGYFFYISKNNLEIQQKYKLGTYIYNSNIIFRNQYIGYDVIIGKEIYDFEQLRKSILNQAIFINLFSIIIVFAMSYFVTNRVLKPLLRLSKIIRNYDISENTNMIPNKYGDSEIGIITDSINKFIGKTKDIFEAQKQFIEDSSHELKTPLMQIHSNLELLEDKVLDEKSLERLEHIKSSTENINTIVSNLSFILRGQERITKKECINIYEYLKDFIEQFKYQAKEKDIEIVLHKKGNLELENSRYYLDRLFGNLIQNAIYYNDGNSEITIEVFDDTVTIQDRGIGISKEEIEKICSRFYRNSNSGLYNANGSGLGLTIVNKICRDFYWNLKIDSVLGEGTTFTIYFTICMKKEDTLENET